jgi:drug/metabolite transporter (DMT)-like permease
MVSGGYLIILAASSLLFRERLGAFQYAGVTLIIGGIWMVVR